MKRFILYFNQDREKENKQMTFDNKKLGQIRRKRGLSVNAAFKRLYDHGLDISRPTLINWEEGKTEPDASALFILADFYHVDPSFFLRKN
jgi:transcriptional regulator with XRE-family HTH domain